jgi:hypothetical protein
VASVADDADRLAGGWRTDIRRHGDVVYRTAGAHSLTVMALLDHLHGHGFDAAPRPVAGGVTSDGREQLTYVDGASPQPDAWTIEGAWEIGRLLRQLHDTAAGFDPGPSPVWQRCFARDLPSARPVIGHGDLGPWNILARNGRPVAFIDWDTAGPVDALWELAQVAWLNAQLHDDDVAALNGLPEASERIRQCAAILDGYRLDADGRHGFVERMIEFAIRSARDEAHEHSVTPATTSPAPDGLPTLWAIAWRTNAAAWMLDHRDQLDHALHH